jgi:hypothetical protein
MTLPAFLFGGLMASLYGASFHLWRGGNFGKLILYLAFSWLGFWIGHVVAAKLGWTIASVGPLRLGMATVGSLVFLFGGYFLSFVDLDDRKR